MTSAVAEDDMAFNWFRNWNAKRQKAKQTEQKLNDKAAADRLAIRNTQAAIEAEAKKQQQAEARGDEPAAQEAGRKKEQLQQQNAFLQDEKKTLETGAVRAHEKAERAQAGIQNARQKLELATGYVNHGGEEKTPQPGSVTEQKILMEMQDAANRVPPTQDQEARSRRIGEKLLAATQFIETSAPAPPNPNTDEGGNAALLQKQSNQDITQKALSPTDASAGKTALQGDGIGSPTESHKATEAVKPTQPTIARRPPSWER
jgi:hypothetical protein